MPKIGPWRERLEELPGREDADAAAGFGWKMSSDDGIRPSRQRRIEIVLGIGQRGRGLFRSDESAEALRMRELGM
jgi:hypothetical protein